MADDIFRFAELVVWLKEEGYGEAEVGQILDRLRRQDELTEVDSVMDAIGQGKVDIGAIIRDALVD